MSKTWDGRPENPERNGWHWVIDLIGTGEPMVFYWSAPRELWLTCRYGNAAHPNPKAWRYLGSCLTPAELAAQVEAAERRGMDRALNIARNVAHEVAEIIEGKEA